MIFNETIVHVLDTNKGNLFLSESCIDVGLNFSEILEKHIDKLTLKDDSSNCTFSKDSIFPTILEEYKNDNKTFINFSKNIAKHLYNIMETNINIPAADLIISHVLIDKDEYIAILKMNYQKLYGHTTKDNKTDLKIFNDLISSDSGAKITEAALIKLDKLNSIKLIEKKYEVNGEKQNYFSGLFLSCYTNVSTKSKIKNLNKALTKVQEKYYDHNLDKKIEDKAKIAEIFNEKKEFNPKEIEKALFSDQKMANDFDEMIEKFDLKNEIIKPIIKTTANIINCYKIKTSTGIEIKIPLDENNNNKYVSVNRHSDGSMELIIKDPNILEELK